MPKDAQGCLFEEDYLRRTLPVQLMLVPDVALTELVANAWDAGATRVEIRIPDELGDWLVVEDNGAGLTEEEFRTRWMTLAYNRLSHQGRYADCPPGRESAKRTAFGRNGVGRHGMLCFADAYEVDIRKDRRRIRVVVRISAGEYPIQAEFGSTKSTNLKSGTRIRARVQFHLPDSDRVRQVISARFMQDPNFQIFVNGERLSLIDLSGEDLQRDIMIADGFAGRLYCVDATKRAYRLFHHGVAFWVNHRLVGKPSWSIGSDSILDGRSREARRYSFIVDASVLEDHVLSDWAGFKPTPEVDGFLSEVARQVRDVIAEVSSSQITEKKEEAVRTHADQIRDLPRGAKYDITRVVEGVSARRPTIQLEDLGAVVQAVVELESTRTGRKLLQKLVSMDERDRGALDRLLEEWTVQDAMAVLDEIDRRLGTAEAIAKLSKDPNVDELHTLHPLVTQARWLFGPEYESPNYTSNLTLRNALGKVIGPGVAPENLPRQKVRPDLLIRKNSTFSAVAVEEFENGEPLTTLRRVLLIELKRGGFKLGREEIQQAANYVEDILMSGNLHGPPRIDAFVVGHAIDTRVAKSRKVGDDDLGRIQAVTFSHLVDSANARLFRLREHLEARYEGAEADDLVTRVLGEPRQLGLSAPMDNGASGKGKAS